MAIDAGSQPLTARQTVCFCVYLFIDGFITYTLPFIAAHFTKNRCRTVRQSQTYVVLATGALVSSLSYQPIYLIVCLFRLW